MDDHFVRSAGVKEKAVGSDVALYVEAKRSIHVLNPTARFVWEALAVPMTFEELLFVLTQAFDVSGDTAERDLRETLDRFSAAGLVLQTPGDDSALA